MRASLAAVRRNLHFPWPVLLLFPISSFTFVAGQPTTLYWDASHRLNFSDFRGHAPVDSKKNRQHGEGRIAGAIIKSIVADTRRRSGKTIFVVYASMKPDQSWIAKNGDSTALRHEQGHFDICEIFARKLRREIGNVSSVDEAKKMWNAVLDQEDAEQTRYDNANTYQAGGITAAWKKLIRQQLRALEAWSRAEVPAPKMK